MFLTLSAFANDGNLNFYGQNGVHKTQSAQTLGHGRFGVGFFAEGAGLYDLVQNGRICAPQNAQYGGDPLANSCAALPISSYVGINAYPFISLGLSDFFDFGISLPIYGEFLKIDNGANLVDTDNLSASGQGNLQILTKFRAPFEDFPIDLALLLGGVLSTGRTDNYGLWVRDPSYLALVGSDDSIGKYPIAGGASTYTNNGSMMKFGVAVTLDLNKTSKELPLLFHFNYGYRMTLGEWSSRYPKVQNISVATEWTPSEFISLFGEYYMDMPNAFPKLTENGESVEDYAGLSTLSLGTALHFNEKVDLQLGFQMLLGDEDKYIDNLTVPLGGKTDNGYQKYAQFNAALVPKYAVFGGLTFKIFVLTQDLDGDGVSDDKDECPEESGPKWNKGCPAPDPDKDGDEVCDAWVSEKGLDDYYASVCEGIDQCPNQEGDLENDGCPAAEPDADDDGVCDAWVAEKGQLKKYASVCKGIDKCPNKKGELEDDGCPTDNPDNDGDGICDPWVSQKGQFAKFAKICKGYDECPGEAGVKENKGCPWDDPDPDGDGVCDSWVAEKKLSIQFKDQCAGIDACPAESGPKYNNGCPLPDPDPDQDGVCDAWVTEKKLQSEFKDICTGIDKCPAEAGEGKDGCPKAVEPEPDVDGDGICDEWVAASGQLKKFAKVCTGIDKCPNVPGTAKFDGCEPPPIEEKVELKGVTFGSGNATLTPNAKKVLDGVAEQLNAAPNVKIEIQGHTDNQGKAQANQELSERRAKAVVGYLATKGVKLSRMRAIGYGPDVPVADNKTKDGRELNRRIEMIKVDD
ncbi:hypothetical protein AGMMS49938_10020 [Fibrobacterales bacterium]|nr:hypothetical protein AGMMS49938_10020 [Fibrobacterales bacterium]